MDPRVAIIVPCFNSGRLVAETVASLAGPEPFELVIVDDVSTDAETVETLARLEADGVRVLRLPENVGVANARTAGVAATRAPLVMPLDADDLALPDRISRAADVLEADPGAAACVGDYEEFGRGTIVRAVPHILDPYRVAYTNEYPITAVLRRVALERHGAWRDPSPTQRGYEDWNLWMDLAQDRERVVHLGAVLYRRRMHAPGLDVTQRERHAHLYRALRTTHPGLFGQLGEHRRRTTLSPARTALYPLLYGERRLINRLRAVKPLADRIGFWTPNRR
jgi:glycosyltransferase involved in cell wall biosynthesis